MLLVQERSYEGFHLSKALYTVKEVVLHILIRWDILANQRRDGNKTYVMCNFEQFCVLS